MNEHAPLLVIIGPTAVGKSETSLRAAAELNGEIINGDSMQVYQGMDVGTAKVSAEERNLIPHHLFDICTPQDNFSVADFQQEAKRAIADIHSRGKLPIIVGGTGLYVSAVIYDYQFSSSGEDETIRKRREQQAAEYGDLWLHGELQKVDPESAAQIHPHNRHRVIRALEVYERTGRPISERAMEAKTSPYDVRIIGLTMDREQLYARINARVDQMIEKGLLDEVQKLLEHGYRETKAMKGIGYKEMIPVIDKTVPLAEASEQLKRNTRRFAKRQLTWFRNKMDVEWFDLTGNREEKIGEIIARLK
ncbi:tRNA (adenosine(37)-N6)-dimethylallyltransferase MiaA [Salisediminibacterium halotolerans]|uniref:tRNA dimethylallyltransferase n=1 Tax=Salisediminibacterium halotolerans TaxID=517425 RepID=A0A1H9W7M4_9BACI|nr:tRNA (adenosine(37)-N6)-dimethylallyltransferase MiaA [Salisediminibacterium haloalkalitolerans]SES29463.1 tRNA dimethylallyltransferase [Salisediminibacterium haloalkalitolerans]